MNLWRVFYRLIFRNKSEKDFSSIGDKVEERNVLGDWSADSAIAKLRENVLKEEEGQSHHGRVVCDVAVVGVVHVALVDIV